MNELLQKHGCSNVFTIPEGLQELMSDISREVLREQPVNVCDFITNYLSALLITREHGVLAVKILEDLCDCRPSVSQHLINCGMTAKDSKALAQIIKEEIERVPIVEGKEKVKEADILKKILKRNPLDEEMTAKVCEVARNAYRDYWYRKKMLEQNLKEQPDELWEQAAQHTLELYKRTKPCFSDLARATQKIQAAYRGYHVRRRMLLHLKAKPKPHMPKVDLQGPVTDIAESRHIDLGAVVDIDDKVKKDEMTTRFATDLSQDDILGYDTTMTITHEPHGKQGRDITGDSSKDSKMMSDIMADNKELRKRSKSKQSGLYGQMDEKLDHKDARGTSMGGHPEAPPARKSIGGFIEPGDAAKKSSPGFTYPTDDSQSPKQSMGGFTDPESQPTVKQSFGGFTDTSPKKSVGGFIEPENVSKKSIAGFIEPGDVPNKYVEPSSVVSGNIGPPTESDGPGQDMASDIPEDIPVSEPTRTFDLSSDAGSKTASVPTSASTTAPTSDVEDDVPTEAEEE